MPHKDVLHCVFMLNKSAYSGIAIKVAGESWTASLASFNLCFTLKFITGRAS